MFLVGLTGGIASGKSTVSRILKDLGCAIVDADLIARQILLPGKPAYKAVVQHFGICVLNDDKTIDRAALASIIFNDEQKRKTLNSITHREIGKVMWWEIIKSFMLGKRFVILDVPLLIESKFWLNFSKHVVVVYCKPEIQLQRLIARNDYTKEEALSRINSQMSLDEKKKFATLVIDNSNSLEATRQQVLTFYSSLKDCWTLNIYELCVGFCAAIAGIVMFLF